MCCSRPLYTANQIFFGPKNSGWGDLCHFCEVTGGSSRPLCWHGMLGLGGRSKSHCSPAPPLSPRQSWHIFPGEHRLICAALSRMRDGRREGDPPPYPAPGWVVNCTPWHRRLDSALYRCELSWALNIDFRRHYGGWESAKNRQCGFYMLRHAAPKFCITAFWSCSAANLGLCSNSKCIQKVAFRSRPAVKVSLLE